MLRELNERACSIEEFPITADVLAAVVKRIVAGELTVKSGRDVFDALLSESDAGTTPTADRIAAIIDEQGLAVPSDTGELDALIDAAATKNAKAAADVRAGKLQAVGPLIGMVMGQLKGADPKQVRQRIIERLQES